MANKPPQIVYRHLFGYRYALMETYIETIPIASTQPRDLVSSNGWIELTSSGVLSVMEGYAWDGPSGPLGRLNDTLTFMRGSLVHDALYQLMREGLLSEANRVEADMLLRHHCIEDGMSRFRAAYVYRAVRWFGASSARRRRSLPVVRRLAP